MKHSALSLKLYHHHFGFSDRSVRSRKNFQQNHLKFSSLFTQRVMFMLIMFCTVMAAQAGQIHGWVTNAETGQPLTGANIQIKNSSIGTTSHANGEFSLDAPEGEVALTISFIGYNTFTQTLTLDADGTTEVKAALTAHPLTTDEITVTSLRYEQLLKNIAMPVSVVSHERIETLAPRDAAEAVRGQAGLAITRDGVWGSNITIRGLSRNNIVTLIDGNRIDTANDLTAGLSMIDVNDIERVEVIKGAASSLYGTGAVGGVVNVVTRDGWYDSSFYVRGTVSGGFSSVNESGEGYLRLNAGSRKWYAKVSAQSRNAGDVRTPAGIMPNSRYSDESLAARIGFRPFENHEIKVNVQRYRGKDIGIPGGTPLFTSTSDVSYPRENRDLFSVEYIGGNITPSLARVSLKFFQQDILRDVENIPHIVKQVPGTPAKVMNVLSILPQATHETSGAHLQTDWVFSGNHLIAGVDAWQKHLDSFRERVARVDVLNAEGGVAKSMSQITGERPIPVATFGSVGFFAQNELPAIAKRLTMTVGGRMDKIFIENEAALQPLYMIVDGQRNDAPAGQTALWTAQKADDASWSGNLSMLYRLKPNANLTFTAARSFRSPYLEERYQYIDLGNLVKIGDPTLKAEKGLFGDLGLRLYQGKSSLALNFFYNNIHNMVVEMPTTFEGRNALKKTNVGSAQLYGADLQCDFPLWTGTRAYAAVAYVYGQDTFIDQPLPLTPPINGSLGIEAPLGNWLRYELAASFFGDQGRIAAWELETPGYVVFDVYFSSRALSFGSFSTRLFFGIENLTDRAFRNHLSTNRGSVTVEPGRNFNFRLQTSI